MSGVEISIGAALVIIALTTQYVLTKRLKDGKARRYYAWFAWAMAYIGGVGIATDISSATGITVVGATVASFVMLAFIVADLWDKRPDWTAFILIILAPAFMSAVGGPVGAFFDLLLLPGSLVSSNAAGLIGA